MNSKDYIEVALRESIPSWLAIHEIREVFNIGRQYSENNLATRCPEMAKAGTLVSRRRKGKRFKEWALKSRVQGE